MANEADQNHASDTDLVNWDAASFLKKVTNVAPGVIYIFNQHTQSNEYANRSLGETLGYSADEVLKMGAELFPALCHPEDLGRIGDYFAHLRTLADGDNASTEYRMRHKNGNWVWLLSHDAVFDRASDGSVLRHIGIASDITPQKEAEEKAIAEKLRATTTNDELRAFSYSMSHDMKAPSNTLNLLLNELLNTHRDTLDPDVIELLNMSLETVNRMGILVEDVLNYTRVIDRDLEIEPVALNPLVADILEDLRELSQDAAAKITATDLPDVMADAAQMRILFKNLIENAIKFHQPDENPQIKIYAEPEPDLKKCTITVEDNGIGIDPSKHEQVFTIFKRLNAIMEFSGTGLGLAICRRIAANHDSKITLTSEQGQGAAFSIGLNRA